LGSKENVTGSTTAMTRFLTWQATRRSASNGVNVNELYKKSRDVSA